jgi:hypothetical protein
LLAGAGLAGQGIVADMTVRALQYSVGNEHSPTNPWGRSELLVDESVHLRHHFSRVRREAAWAGDLSAAAATAVWAAFDRSAFPVAPSGPVVPDTTFARITVDGTSVLTPHRAAGYAELFDVLDGIIRQVSGGEVPYPSTSPVTVDRVRAV